MYTVSFPIFTISMVLLLFNKGKCDLGIIHARNSLNYGDFCIAYNPDFQQIASTQQDAPYLNLSDLTPSMLCSDPVKIHPPGTAWALDRGNCSFSEKALIVQKFGGKAALVVSKDAISTPSANTSEYNAINITVAIIKSKDFDKIQSFGANVEVQFYAPPIPKMDYNLAVIWLLAVGTVAIGSYISGVSKHRIYMKKRRKKTGERDDGTAAGDASEEEDEKDDLSDLDISWPFIIVFVVAMCGMLVALYFFYDYLVYVVIGLFALACSTALYGTLKPLMLRIPCFGTCKIRAVNIRCLPCLRKRTEVRRFILGVLCLGVGVVWAVFRNEPWAWILQDILGVLFCIQMLKTLRLPNLKVICTLLVLLFVYDIFFVFITPLFTKKGESIMVKVATGGESKSGEMLPMVLKVPRFQHSVLSVCSRPFSLLGFGDIMVPGLLVSFCHGFDLKVGSNRIYYIASVIAYGVGLVITFAALALMEKGQPALLYLVPCTLLTTVVIALCRKELKHMWNGEVRKEKGKKGKNQSINECNSTDSANQPGCHDIEEEVGSIRDGDEQNLGGANTLSGNNLDDDVASDTSNEQQRLLSQSAKNAKS